MIYEWKGAKLVAVSSRSTISSTEGRGKRRDAPWNEGERGLIQLGTYVGLDITDPGFSNKRRGPV